MCHRLHNVATTKVTTVVVREYIIITDALPFARKKIEIVVSFENFPPTIIDRTSKYREEGVEIPFSFKSQNVLPASKQTTNFRAESPSFINTKSMNAV